MCPLLGAAEERIAALGEGLGPSGSSWGWK
jgi:hypothetical protein